MKFTFGIAVALLSLPIIGSATPVQANEISEVVGARANARAGGPLSPHDAELIDRYGALSGTRGYSPGGTRYEGYRTSRKHWRHRRYRQEW